MNVESIESVVIVLTRIIASGRDRRFGRLRRLLEGEEAAALLAETSSIGWREKIVIY